MQNQNAYVEFLIGFQHGLFFQSPAKRIFQAFKKPCLFQVYSYKQYAIHTYDIKKTCVSSWDQADELELRGPRNSWGYVFKKTWIIITLNVSFMKFSCILIFSFLQYYEAVKRKNADTKCKMIALFQKIDLKSIFWSRREEVHYDLGKVSTSLTFSS